MSREGSLILQNSEWIQLSMYTKINPLLIKSTPAVLDLFLHKFGHQIRVRLT